MFAFLYDSCSSFVNNFVFSFQNFTACSLLQYLRQYTSFPCSMFLKDYIVDIEKPDGICSPNFVADEFSFRIIFTSISLFY